MQLEFRTHASESASLQLGERTLPIVFVRNDKARRYILRLKRDGVARVTVPRYGSLREARAFAERHRAWIEQQLLRISQRAPISSALRIGDTILFRGQPEPITLLHPSRQEVRVGEVLIVVKDTSADLRLEIEQALQQIAVRELPLRLLELAAAHGLSVHRVSIRSQRSRWGSCSRRATISLNWRLVQTPPFVRDYILVHELMHLREMNHSARFWRHVESVCPEYQQAERWLNANGALLRPNG